MANLCSEVRQYGSLGGVVYRVLGHKRWVNVLLSALSTKDGTVLDRQFVLSKLLDDLLHRATCDVITLSMSYFVDQLLMIVCHYLMIMWRTKLCILRAFVGRSPMINSSSGRRLSLRPSFGE